MSDAKNHETVQAIKEFMETRGYPPRVRELGKILGLSSPASVHQRLLECEEAGLIERVTTGTSTRAIRIMGVEE